MALENSVLALSAFTWSTAPSRFWGADPHILPAEHSTDALAASPCGSAGGPPRPGALASWGAVKCQRATHQSPGVLRVAWQLSRSPLSSQSAGTGLHSPGGSCAPRGWGPGSCHALPAALNLPPRARRAFQGLLRDSSLLPQMSPKMATGQLLLAHLPLNQLDGADLLHIQNDMG